MSFFDQKLTIKVAKAKIRGVDTDVVQETAVVLKHTGKLDGVSDDDIAQPFEYARKNGRINFKTDKDGVFFAPVVAKKPMSGVATAIQEHASELYLAELKGVEKALDAKTQAAVKKDLDNLDARGKALSDQENARMAEERAKLIAPVAVVAPSTNGAKEKATA